MDLEFLTAALDELSGSDLSAFADTESIVQLHRQLARLEAIVTEATAAFDAAGNWVPDGARNASAWLTSMCHLPRTQARRQVRRGRELRHLPDCSRAWRDGDITAAQVDVIVSLRSDITQEALARDEEMLVDQARTLRHGSLVRAAAYWKQLADPDGTDEEEEKRRSRRDVYLANSFGGMWLGKMTLDPVSGAIVGSELERLEHHLFEADWAEARKTLGRDPHPSELARSPGQRRADALVEMATRSGTAPAGGRRPEPRSPCWSASRRCTGGSVSWPTERWWPPAHCLPGWTGPTWSGRYSHRVAGWRSAPPPGCSPGPPDEPSRCGTASAPIPPAMCRRPPAKPTTSSPSQPVAPPLRRTADCCAASTLACGTSAHHLVGSRPSRSGRRRCLSKSRVEAHSHPIECAQPEVPPTAPSICAGHRPPGQLDPRVAEWLGREGEWLLGDELETGPLGHFTRQKVEHDLRAESRCPHTESCVAGG